MERVDPRSLLVALLAWSASAHAQDCKTYEVSKGTGGSLLLVQAQGGFLSDDGRLALFDGPNMPQYNMLPHVWLRDETTGVTTQVDLSSSGAPSAKWAQAMDLSEDGNIVLFWTTDANLVPGDTNGLVDLFARDLTTGLTTRVSVSSGGAQANGVSYDGCLSSDGRYVVFGSHATNLVPGDTNGWDDVFVHDRLTGQTERVSVASDGSQADGASLSAQISADGRWVVFESWADNLHPGDVNGEGDAFVHDRQTGSTSAVSLTPAGRTASGSSLPAAISDDGRFVAFSSWAPDLVAGDTNGVSDAFLRDRVTASTLRVGLGTGGAQLDGDSFASDLSADASILLFSSAGTAVTPDDVDTYSDAFRRDLLTGAVERISKGWVGDTPGNDSPMFAGDLTPDGSFASFSSEWWVLVRGCPLQVARYGAAKPNSLGCYPWITWSGEPSASAGSGFLVRAQAKLNQVPGLMIYGYQGPLVPSVLPFLLVGPPIVRLPGTSTGGSPTGKDCSGSMQVDFNAWIAAGSDPTLVPGVTVYAQFWSRDADLAPPGNYSFSDAVEITVLP